MPHRAQTAAATLRVCSVESFAIIRVDYTYVSILRRKTKAEFLCRRVLCRVVQSFLDRKTDVMACGGRHIELLKLRRYIKAAPKPSLGCHLFGQSREERSQAFHRVVSWTGQPDDFTD